MKARLGLPKDHCWTPEDWREFCQIDSKQLAEELQAPVEEVENALFLKEEHWYTQPTLPLSGADLRLFVAEIVSISHFKNAKLYAGMFRFIFGKSAEEFSDYTHSWLDDDWQAGIEESEYN